MRISDWSSDVCSSDLLVDADAVVFHHGHRVAVLDGGAARHPAAALGILDGVGDAVDQRLAGQAAVAPGKTGAVVDVPEGDALLVGQRLEQAADLAEQRGAVAALLPHLPRHSLAAGVVEDGADAGRQQAGWGAEGTRA